MKAQKNHDGMTGGCSLFSAPTCVSLDMYTLMHTHTHTILTYIYTYSHTHTHKPTNVKIDINKLMPILQCTTLPNELKISTLHNKQK